MASKDWRTVQDKLREQGWTVTQTSHGHYRAAPPDKTKRIVHFSESAEPRAIMNSISDLRKSGFIWDEEPPSRRGRQSKPPEAAPDGVLPLNPSLPPLPAVNVAAAPTRVGATPESPPDLDRVFAELKEAKSYAQLASDHYREKLDALALARQALEDAEHELKAASEKLAEKKLAFDTAFNVTAKVA